MFTVCYIMIYKRIVIRYGLVKNKKQSMRLPIPVEKGLKVLGKDIRTARIRRRVTMQAMAKHAAISRTTLTRVENGDPAVSIGTYANVIFILGLFSDLEMMTHPKKDELGHHLDIEKLPKRVSSKRATDTHSSYLKT